MARMTAERPPGKGAMVARNARERKKRLGYEPRGGRTSPLARALVRVRSSSSISF